MQCLKNKIPPPIVAAIFALAIWLLTRHSVTIEIDSSIRILGAIIIATFGLCIDIAAILAFRTARTTVNPMRPDAASSLVKKGVYQYSRNPMYVGLVLFLVAWVFYLAAPIMLIIVFGFVLYIHYLQIIPEEKVLINIFGEEYLTYKATVRRWL